MLITQNQLGREVDFLSRVVVTVAGKPATQHDLHQFCSVTILRYGLESDLLSLPSITQSTHRRSIHDVKAVDLMEYARDFKLLKSTWLSQLGVMSPRKDAWHDFKRRVSGKLSNKWLLATVEKLFGNPKALLQWLSFDERLLLDSNDDVSQEIADYLSFEADLTSYTYDDGLLERLRSIITQWLSGLELWEEFPKPRFGPGVVAEGGGRLSALDKARRFVYDAHTVDSLCEMFACERDDIVLGCAGDAAFTNRIIFRPKNALAHRIISAEPNWLMWLQETIKCRLFDYVDHHHAMNTWFRDQSRSRELALQGSKDGSYATFDFSSASDSVTYPLVAELFADTNIGEALLLTRSRKALMPDGQTTVLRKFAPMGSRTCFATMDIILLAACELAIRTSLGRRGNYTDYVVYGDDVIIRTEAARQFVSITTSLHFRLNQDKSYCEVRSSNYRESCGIEALDGVDITPLRYSRFQEPLIRRSPVEPEWWEAAITLMNRALVEYHYYGVRSAAYELIRYSCEANSAKSKDKAELSRSILDHVLRVDESDWVGGDTPGMAIVTPDATATQYRCKHRWNSNLQRKEYRVRTVQTADYPRLPEDDYLLRGLWDFYSQLGSPTEEGLESVLSGVTGVQSQKWVWKWVGA